MALVLAAETDARLALASVVLITKQFEGHTAPRGHIAPKCRGCRVKSYINVQEHSGE